MTTGWNKRACTSRISDSEKRTRFAAGSPDEAEIAAYNRATIHAPGKSLAVVLGMTPELRVMALRKFDQVFSIDSNPTAIDLYQTWVPEYLRLREMIVKGDWLDILRRDLPKADVVLGDGVFGNLPDIQAHDELINSIKHVLKPGGLFITRKFTVPGDPSDWQNFPDQLIEQYTNGQIDSIEFGFAMRLLGHLGCCYDPKTAILDNSRVFHEADEDVRSGKLTPTMRDHMNRFYFAGRNCLVTLKLWEEMLKKNGMSFKIMECSGKHWYSYYRVYRCCTEQAPK